MSIDSARGVLESSASAARLLRFCASKSRVRSRCRSRNLNLLRSNIRPYQ